MADYFLEPSLAAFYGQRAVVYTDASLPNQADTATWFVFPFFPDPQKALSVFIEIWTKAMGTPNGYTFKMRIAEGQSKQPELLVTVVDRGNPSNPVLLDHPVWQTMVTWLHYSWVEGVKSNQRGVDQAAIELKAAIDSKSAR